MARDIYCFTLKPSEAVNLDCATVSNLRDFRGARKRSKQRPAVDARIFFDEGKTRRFVNPLWLPDVVKALRASSYGGKVKGATNALTCTTTWTFSGAEDPDLRRFDDFYEEKGLAKNVHLLHVDLARPTRVLLPQHVYDFLKKGHDLDDELLDDYTVSFQHYPKLEGGRRDNHDFFAARLLQSLSDLAKAEAASDVNKTIKHSSQLQLTLATRLGLSHVLAGVGKEDDADPANPQTICDFENMLLEFEQDEEGSFQQLHQGPKPKTLIDGMRKMCSEQSCLKNPFGNIIINAGKSTIIGARLPCITISYEAARCLGFWDHEVRSPSGDLQNEELLGMVHKGPCRDGGAWTLHLCYNEAVHLPERHEDVAAARTWLHETLAKHMAQDLIQKFERATQKRATQQCQGDALKISKAFLGGRSLLESLVGASPFAKWLHEEPAAHPQSRSLVTAVQRHSQTLDLMMAVRHPITQPVPHYLLMVDATKTGFALAMPPQFGNLSELDFDGDKMKAAADRAAGRRALLEQCLSVPKLRHSALGKKVVKLSGVAPLALNLAQQNGAAGLDPARLSLQRNSSVVWRGVLETVYSPVYFFDELCAVGQAVPGLLSQRWSQPYFEEVRFRALKKDGAWLSSRKTAISHDGFYPVPVDWTAGNKCAWIAADLHRHKDLFSELQQPFRLELEPERRTSALDGLTFAQMRSLVQVFTPKNFAAKKITVPHFPGLVEEGCFCAFAVPPACPWQRMARVLLKLASISGCILGHDAVVTEMLRYAWRPKESEVAYCILGKDYELKENGGLGLPDLPHSLQDRLPKSVLLVFDSYYSHLLDIYQYILPAEILDGV